MLTMGTVLRDGPGFDIGQGKGVDVRSGMLDTVSRFRRGELRVMRRWR